MDQSESPREGEMSYPEGSCDISMNPNHRDTPRYDDSDVLGEYDTPSIAKAATDPFDSPARIRSTSVDQSGTLTSSEVTSGQIREIDHRLALSASRLKEAKKDRKQKKDEYRETKHEVHEERVLFDKLKDQKAYMMEKKLAQSQDDFENVAAQMVFQEGIIDSQRRNIDAKEDQYQACEHAKYQVELEKQDLMEENDELVQLTSRMKREHQESEQAMASALVDYDDKIAAMKREQLKDDVVASLNDEVRKRQFEQRMAQLKDLENKIKLREVEMKRLAGNLTVELQNTRVELLRLKKEKIDLQKEMLDMKEHLHHKILSLQSEVSLKDQVIAELRRRVAEPRMYYDPIVEIEDLRKKELKASEKIIELTEEANELRAENANLCEVSGMREKWLEECNNLMNSCIGTVVSGLNNMKELQSENFQMMLLLCTGNGNSVNGEELRDELQQDSVQIMSQRVVQNLRQFSVQTCHQALAIFNENRGINQRHVAQFADQTKHLADILKQVLEHINGMHEDQQIYLSYVKLQIEGCRNALLHLTLEARAMVKRGFSTDAVRSLSSTLAHILDRPFGGLAEAFKTIKIDNSTRFCLERSLGSPEVQSDVSDAASNDRNYDPTSPACKLDLSAEQPLEPTSPPAEMGAFIEPERPDETPAMPKLEEERGYADPKDTIAATPDVISDAWSGDIELPGAPKSKDKIKNMDRKESKSGSKNMNFVALQRGLPSSALDQDFIEFENKFMVADPSESNLQPAKLPKSLVPARIAHNTYAPSEVSEAKTNSSATQPSVLDHLRSKPKEHLWSFETVQTTQGLPKFGKIGQSAMEVADLGPNVVAASGYGGHRVSLYSMAPRLDTSKSVFDMDIFGDKQQEKEKSTDCEMDGVVQRPADGFALGSRASEMCGRKRSRGDFVDGTNGYGQKI